MDSEVPDAASTREERDAILSRQNDRPLSAFKINKLKLEAAKNWDLFYKRNSTKFFKDRHWTTREFEELVNLSKETDERVVLLEAGCGVGNFIFPLIEEGLNFFYYGCDFSPRAVKLAQDNPLYNENFVKIFQCDLTKDPLSRNVEEDSVDVVSMIFLLSALPIESISFALQNVYSVLRPGGLVIVRDYGLYDMAQLRFGPGHKVTENCYVRQDGTLASYFSTEYLESLFENNGFATVSNEYVHRMTVNVKEGVSVPRKFIQSRFSKPI